MRRQMLPAELRKEIDRFRNPAEFGPVSEKVIKGFYSAFLRPGDTALDVGVHYGVHLFPMAESVGPDGRIIGVEASPERFSAMKRQADSLGLGQIVLHNVAASHEDGIAVFYVNRSFSGHSGLLRNAKTDADVFEEIRVPTRRLDGLLTDLADLRFCKLDIEGGEAAALAGAAGLLRKFAPVFVYEGDLAKSMEAFGLSEEVARPFASEYRHYSLFGEEIAPGAKASGWNFLAVPAGAAPELVDDVSAALGKAWRTVVSSYSDCDGQNEN